MLNKFRKNEVLHTSQFAPVLVVSDLLTLLPGAFVVLVKPTIVAKWKNIAKIEANIYIYIYIIVACHVPLPNGTSLTKVLEDFFEPSPN